MFDIALICAFVATLYVGSSELRRFGNDAIVYGGMLLVGSALCVAALVARSATSGESGLGNLLGVIAIGAAVCLILVPMVLRDFTRRALLADHLKLARVFVDVRELLQPGMGGDQERDLIDTIIAVRSGRTDEAIERLKKAQTGLEQRARLRLDERIVMTYLYARQWPQAIEHYERLTAGGVDSASLQLLVEMVRAYCESGDLDSAAELVEHLERSAIASDPQLSFLLNRSRMVFLAFVGRTSPVERLGARDGPLGGIPKDAHAFWAGVAKHNAGDKTGAVKVLKAAVQYAGRDKRARELAEAVLEQAQASDGTPRDVSAPVATLADQLTTLVDSAPAVERARQAPRLVGVPLSRIPVTVFLLVANIGVAGLVWLLFDTVSDRGALVRAGAYVSVVTENGQYWRLVTHMFLHVGLLHLALNAYGIWFLGKLCEQLYGTPRMAFIFVASGICAAIISAVGGSAPAAVGASGAVLGLLGATLVELGVHRKRYPQNWTRALLGLLVAIVGANIAIGFIYPMVNHAVHVGGMVSGGLLGLLLSKHTAWGRSKPMKFLQWVLFALSVAALAWGAFGKVTQSYGEGIRFEPRTTKYFPGLALEVPASWNERLGRSITDPSRLVLVSLYATETDDTIDDALLRELHAEQHEGASAAGFEIATTAPSTLALPAGWSSHELAVSTKKVDGRQRYRVVVFGKRFGSSLVLGAAYLPHNLAAELTGALSDMLDSVRLDLTTPPLTAPPSQAP